MAHGGSLSLPSRARRSAAAIAGHEIRALPPGVAPTGNRMAMKSAPRPAQRLGLLGRLDVEGDAGRLEDLRPPGDQLVAPRAGLVAVLEVRRRAEGDVVGAVLRQRHGVVARDAGVDADDAAPPRMLLASA